MTTRWPAAGDGARARPRVPLVAGAALAALLGLTCWSRLSGLGFGLWNDEAFTAFMFVDRGPLAIFLGADVPAIHSLNNHRLFSLLAWATTSVFGDGEIQYRIWAAVPGIASAVIAVIWALRRLGPWEAVVLAFLLATAPLHAEVSTQARGYGLGLLAAVLILIGAVRIADRPGGPGLALLAGGGIVGIWSLSVFAIPFIAQVAPLALLKHGALRIAAVVAAVGLASFAFYWPVLPLIAEAGQQEFGPLVTWTTILVGPCRDLFAGSFDLLWPKADPLAVAVAYVAIVAMAVRELRTRGEGWVLVLLASPVLGTYAVLAILGAHAVPRYVSYLLVHVLVVVAIGIVALVKAARPGTALRRALVAVLLVCAAISLSRFRLLELERLSSAIEGYREAVAEAKRSGIPTVVTNSDFTTGFRHYASRSGLTVVFPSDDELQALFCGRSQPFVYVHYPLYGRRIDLRCLEAREVSVTTIPQRAGAPEGNMRVYVVRG